MATIIATFQSKCEESSRWLILDQGRDPLAPSVVFDDYLAPEEVTGPLTLYSQDGVYASVKYQRSSGSATVIDDVTDGAQMPME